MKLKTNKILLINLPYWTPLIPSQGIANLKSYLIENGYQVKAIDFANDYDLLQFYNQYFQLLEKYLPAGNKGNFFNIGHDLLRNHLTAYINKTSRYDEVLEILIDKFYFVKLDKTVYRQLDFLAESIFQKLKLLILDALKSYSPSVIGISVNSGNYPLALFSFKLSKEFYPDIHTVMGGSVFYDNLDPDNPNFNNFYKSTELYIDNIIIGKGEQLLLELLESTDTTSSNILTSKNIKNNIEIDVQPDLSDYNLNNYYYLAASTSSSCPNECDFCNVRKYFGTYKTKNLKSSANYIKQLYDKYGHRLYFMADSQLNRTIDDFTKELLLLDMPIYYDGYFSIDKASSDVNNTINWRKGGFYRARIGVESGSPNILNKMNKNISPSSISLSLQSLAMAGIKTTTYFVVGYPGETEKDFYETLAFISKEKHNIYQAECNPFTYHYSGLNNFDGSKDKVIKMFPDFFEDMLVPQAWTLNQEPLHEERFRRMNIFVEHCENEGVPNPYTIGEIKEADERWQYLHKNAVPSIIEILNNDKIDEKRNVRIPQRFQNNIYEKDCFNF